MRGFNDVYEKIYNEHQEELEKLRKKRVARKRISILIEITVVIVLYLLFRSFINFKLPAFMEIAIIIVFFTVCFFLRKSKYTHYNSNCYYNEVFKQKIIKNIVKGYNEKLNYIQSGLIKWSLYINGEFEENFDNFSSEDTIYGLLKEKYKFVMSEVETQKEYKDDSGILYKKDIFHGLFAFVQLEKWLNTTIKIRKNAKILVVDENTRIEMDSSEFEEIFNVYAKDKILAMQILTADVMQMLIDFKNETNIIPEITIKNYNLYIRLKTEKMFEANMFKDSLDYSTLKKYYDIVKFSVELSEKLVDSIVQTEL